MNEAGVGLKLAQQLYRKQGISEETYNNWKAKLGGMTVSKARRMKEQESNKLKHLLARIDAQQRGAEKPAGSKVASPQTMRDAVWVLMTECTRPVTRVCGLVQGGLAVPLQITPAI